MALKSIFHSVPDYKGFIPQGAFCYFCDREDELHRHHILPGSLRALSDREGLWVYLCADCHTGPFGIHSKRRSKGFMYTDDEHLRWQAQWFWETNYMVRHECSEVRARMAWRALTKTPLQSYDYVHEDHHGMWAFRERT